MNDCKNQTFLVTLVNWFLGETFRVPKLSEQNFTLMGYNVLGVTGN